MDHRGTAAAQKRHYTPRGTGVNRCKQSKSDSRVVRRPKGSTGISGRCRSDGSMIVKGNWTDAEDERLVELVHQFLDVKRDPKGIASTRWSEIAKELPGRVGKQCRERWHNHLRPDINKGRWTFVEEVIIYLCWRSWSSQWARISRILDGRSDNRVKNHWNCHMKRRLHRDSSYFEFMEDCHKSLIRLVNFSCEDDDFEDSTFRDNLVPKIEQFLGEHRDRLDRLPYFSSTKREGVKLSTTSAPAQSLFPNMASLLQNPIRQPKRPAKALKMKAKRRRHDSSSEEEGPRITPVPWLSVSPDVQRDVNEENNYTAMHRGLTLGSQGSPVQYFSHYGSGLSQESYVSDDKGDMQDLMAGGGGLMGSPCGNYLYSQDTPGFRSPIPSCSMEVVVEENGTQQPVLYGDPLWSRAVSADFSVGSPTYFPRTGGATLTSTPLKQTSSFNVPSASECGAGLLSPYLGLRQFPGFHSGDDALLSPIRRSFCETSSIDETVWSPNKMVHGRWSPVKLGSIVNMVKTPQAIREALARSEINRSRISPEDVSGGKEKKEEEGVSKSDRALPPSGFVFQNLAVLASPSRLFSDASELIDGEMNQSGHGMGKESLMSPEIVKCRRRLTDQWTNLGTPSFCSSGYASFHTTPGGGQL